MKRILTALVLIPLVLLAVFKAPSWLFTLLVGAVALLALKEYLDLVEAYGVKPIRWLTYACAMIPFLLTASMSSYVFYRQSIQIKESVSAVIAVLVMCWAFLFLVAAMRCEELKTAFPSAAMSGFGPFYIAIPMLAVALLQQRSWYPLIFTFFAVWAGDIVAMYTGKAIGKHKMSPRISPNKTWEGALGSVVGSVIACSALTHFAPAIQHLLHGNLPPYPADLGADLAPPLLGGRLIFVFAILLNIAAQLGDLVESLIKRGANVKDSGTMLPGHGGILDRIDALLFAAPVALVLFEFIR
jgi:phosphatidate cytidylyltransferase